MIDLEKALITYVFLTKEIPYPDDFEILTNQFNSIDEVVDYALNNPYIYKKQVDEVEYNIEMYKTTGEDGYISTLIYMLFNSAFLTIPSKNDLAQQLDYISQNYPSKIDVIKLFFNKLHNNDYTNYSGLEENKNIILNLYNLAKKYKDKYILIKDIYPNNITEEDLISISSLGDPEFTNLLLKLSGDNIDSAAPEFYILTEIYISDGEDTYIIPLTNSPIINQKIDLVIYPALPVLRM